MPTLSFTALCAQTKTKINFESVASQRFQNLSYGSFDRQLLSVCADIHLSASSATMHPVPAAVIT